MIIVYALNGPVCKLIERVFNGKHVVKLAENAEQLQEAFLAYTPEAVFADLDWINRSAAAWSTLFFNYSEQMKLIIWGDAQKLKTFSFKNKENIVLLSHPITTHDIETAILPKGKKGSQKTTLSTNDTRYSRLRNQMFNNLIDGHSLPEDTDALLRLLKLKDENRKYFLSLVVNFSPVPGTEQTKTIWDIAIQVQAMIWEELKKLAPCRSTIRESNRIAIVLLMYEPGDSFKYDLEKTFEIIEKRVIKECSQQIHVGVGLADDNIPGIAYGYLQASDALDQGRFFGNSCVCFFSDIYDRDSRRLQLSRSVKDNIINCLYNSDFERMDNIIEKEFSVINNSGLATRENILSLKIDLTVFLMDVSNRLSILSEKPALYSRLLEDFLTADSLPILEMNFKEKLRELSSTSVMVQGKRTSKLIRDVQDMIANKMNEPLNVQTIAYYFHISPNYLSAIFRSETGMRLTEYITNIKMREAARLLRSTDMHVSKITETIGYDNANYFARSFKKQYGVTPTEYRRTTE